MGSLTRMLDANINRAREAMRTLEDCARFILEEETPTAELKLLRHSFQEVCTQLPAGWMEANRDVQHDPGTNISTRSEMARHSALDIVIAAGKRLTESLRVIEEVGKSVNVDFAREIESLRYQAYTIDAAMQLRFGSGRAVHWKLCVLITESLCRNGWKATIEASVLGGADCIQIREKEMEDAALAACVRDIIAVVRDRGVSVIVNDRVDIAVATGADGVHLGTRDMTIHDVRRVAGRTLLVGASVHDLSEAKAAINAGADYCGVGTMFASSLKPDRAPAGPAFLKSFIECHPNVPHLAIGGITPTNVGELIEVGARGIAVSSCVCGSDRPEEVVRELREKIDSCVAASCQS